MVCQCGDNTDPDVQLTVIKTLLTVTTAEHFRVHGDCLVQVTLALAVICNLQSCSQCRVYSGVASSEFISD